MKLKTGKKSKKGFTLVEVLISVFVIAFGVLGTVNLIGVITKQSLATRDQVIAMELAQEGVELARNMRDNRLVNAAPGDNIFRLNDPPELPRMLPNNEADAKGCIADFTSLDIKTCAGNNDSKVLYFDQGYYSHFNAGTRTKFKRRFNFDYFDVDGNHSNLNNTVKVEVESKVFWGATDTPCTLQNKCYSIKDTLTQPQ